MSNKKLLILFCIVVFIVFIAMSSSYSSYSGDNQQMNEGGECKVRNIDTVNIYASGGEKKMSKTDHFKNDIPSRMTSTSNWKDDHEKIS